MNQEQPNRLRPVLIGLAALVGVSVLIGGVVSVLALGVAGVTGLGGDDPVDQATAAESSLYIPDSTATEKPSAPTASPPSASPASPTPSKPAEPKPGRPPKPQLISLEASPTVVSTFERINLRGSYRGVESGSLQVQRFEGGWVDFPTAANVVGGSFATYVESGLSGPNRFRVVDESTGRTSKPVSVTVQ